MGNSNDKQNKEYYPMMDHYAAGGVKRSSRRSSGKSTKSLKDSVKKRRESLKNQKKRSITSGLLEKRSPPNRGRRTSGHNVHSRPLSSGRSERDSNKYDGLGDVNYHSTLKRKKAREVRPRTNSLQLMHARGEIMLDVSPPPPPPEDEDPPPAPQLTHEEEALLLKTHSQLSEKEIEFVDYTIIPILLRSKVSYTVANDFGRALKLKYPPARLYQLTSNAYELFAALEHEKIILSEDEKFGIIEDRFWQEAAVESSKGKRSSFVYHRENDSKNFRKKGKKKKREPRESFSERLSKRQEFEEQPVLAENEGMQFDVGALRKSLRIFNDEIVKNERL